MLSEVTRENIVSVHPKLNLNEIAAGATVTTLVTGTTLVACSHKKKIVISNYKIMKSFFSC